MLLKLAGNVLLLAACSGGGLAMAGRCQARCRHMNQLYSALTALRSCINYAALPLPAALSQCCRGLTGPVAQLFHSQALLLKENSALAPAAALEKSLAELTGQLCFKAQELELLRLLAANLGAMNREEQSRHITMVMEQLQVIGREAGRRQADEVRLYRYLGICGGLALIILLA